MAAKGREFVSPIGRILWGHPLIAQQKRDQETNQLILDEKGMPIDQWAFGVGFDLNEFAAHVWPHLAAEAATGYPNGTPSNFSFKYIDSRSVDKKGRPYSEREGYAGMAILTLSTELQAPQVVTMLGSTNGLYRQLTDKEIKCGDYVRVGINVTVNVPKLRTHTPSLYVNPLGVELVGYGQEIRRGPDVIGMFSGAAPVGALPPGASTTPIGGAPGVNMPGMGMPAHHPGNAPGAPAAMPNAPGHGVAPHTATGAYHSNQGHTGGMMAPPAHDFVNAAAGHAMPQHQQPGNAPGMFPMPVGQR